MTTKKLSIYGTCPVLLRKPKNAIRFLASAGDWHFCIVSRGVFRVLDRDAEVSMPPRAKNKLIGI